MPAQLDSAVLDSEFGTWAAVLANDELIRAQFTATRTITKFVPAHDGKKFPVWCFVGKQNGVDKSYALVFGSHAADFPVPSIGFDVRKEREAFLVDMDTGELTQLVNPSPARPFPPGWR